MVADLKVTYVEASALHPNGWNPNEMDEGMLDRLRKEIERVGFVQPVAALKDGTIIDGEHRWMVARDMGWKIPVVYIDVDEVTAKTLCININAIRGKNDPGLLVTLLESLGMSNEDMEDVLGITATDMNKLQDALEAPDIKEFDEDIETRHECPRCGYKWS